MWDDGTRLALKYPLGTTHVNWDAIAGDFQARPHGYVTFELTNVDLARRNALFRIAVRLGRSLHDASMRVSAPQFRLTAEELAEVLNARLASRRAANSPPV